MATTQAIFEAKVTTEAIDDSSPVVAGDTYPALQSVIVDTDSSSDYVDKNGRPAANDAPVTVRIPDGDPSVVISAGAKITPTEFLLVEIVTSDATDATAGLRGAPADDLTALGLLVAKEGERRHVKANNSDYHFKLTADLNATEDASPSSVADAAATGKWVRQSFAALVDGYTYSGIDVANSSFGAGAIGFRHGGFNTIYDPKGLVDTGGSTITIDSPEKAGAYLMALNVTSGTLSGRVNARVNGNTVLIASGEDGTDSDAAVGVVELVEGDVVTLAITGGGTTYGVSFTMSQVRRFVDETQYVASDQLIPVDNPLEDLIAEGAGSWTADETITLNNGKTWNDLLTDGYEKIFISAKENSWRGRNIGSYHRLEDVIRDTGASAWTVASGSNRYEITIGNVTGSGTSFTVQNGANGGHTDFKMWGVRAQKELVVINPADIVVDTTGAVAGDTLLFQDDGAGGLELVKGQAPGGMQAVLLAERTGTAFTTGQTFTLAGGRTWQNVLDEFQFVYVNVGNNSLFTHDQSRQWHVSDLSTQNRDMAITDYQTFGSNGYHFRMRCPAGSSTTVLVDNDGSTMQVERIKIMGIK